LGCGCGGGAPFRIRLAAAAFFANCCVQGAGPARCSPGWESSLLGGKAA